MKLPFRVHHLCQLLETYEQHPGKPFDYSIACYFREHKALGSKDRIWIGDTAYALLRWKVLYDYLLKDQPQISWLDRFSLYLKSPPQLFVEEESLPPFIRAACPQELFHILEKTFAEKTLSLCIAQNERAPSTIRANALKITREELLARLQKTILGSGFENSNGVKNEGVPNLQSQTPTACTQAPFGICLHSRMNFFSMQEFKEGLFEVQDEASQLVGEYVPIKSGDRVLDYCAGAGGKTLAFAYKLQKHGQIYLHDIRPYALLEAKKRLRRAGVQNSQIINSSEEKKLRLLQHTADAVLVDAPCSGTGTLRRNPDMKFKICQKMLSELTAKQYEIFSQALQYVKPGGYIVYATCSILKEENEEQMEKFLKEFPLEVAKDPLKTVPQKDSMDGFFAICFRVTR